MLEKPLGKFILGQILEMQEELEKGLVKVSTKKEEWAVKVDYKFSLNEFREIRDSFTVQIIPYIDDKKQGAYNFKFMSLETIFLSEICEIIYQTTQNPEQAENIINRSMVTMEYLQV